MLSDVKETGSEIAIRETNADIENISNDIADLEISIGELTDKINGATGIALSKEEFLNLEIDHEKRPHFLWKEPFKTLLESQQFTTGAHERT